MAYDFNRKFQFGHFEVQVDTKAMYGYFEHDIHGDGCGGGLWFEQSAEKDAEGSFKLSLVDYDGVAVLPAKVAEGLRESGFIVESEFN